MTHFYLGDMLFQLVLLFNLILPIVLIIFLVKYVRKQNAQKRRIEEKLDLLLKDKEQVKKE